MGSTDGGPDDWGDATSEPRHPGAANGEPRDFGDLSDKSGDVADGSKPPHRAVLLEESLAALAIRPGGVYVDATYGAGGHSRGIVARGGIVVAFDRDPDVKSARDLQPGPDAPTEPGARTRPDVAPTPSTADIVPTSSTADIAREPLANRVTLLHRNFDELGAALDDFGIAAVDGVLFDLGVSSMQFDRAERGFSLTKDGPLDMRMNPGGGPTAYDLLARSSERELADIIFHNGEERGARRIARAIVAAREAGRLPKRTLELARLVSGAVHRPGTRERLHPATRTFQALRIAVNDELGSLERGLDAAAERLRPGGRIAAISFHSLEDRIVKRHFREDERLHALTRKPIAPTEEELELNARARSARLRVAERT